MNQSKKQKENCIELNSDETLPYCSSTGRINCSIFYLYNGHQAMTSLFKIKLNRTSFLSIKINQAGEGRFIKPWKKQGNMPMSA